MMERNGRRVTYVCGMACAVVVSGLLSGCQSRAGGIDRHPIEGEVTFNGAAVPHGEILFEPDPEKGNSGPASSGIIKNSKFEIPAARGVVGGAYVVRISGRGEASGGNEHDVDPGEELFPEYVTSIDIPDGPSTQTFDVPAD